MPLPRWKVVLALGLLLLLAGTLRLAPAGPALSAAAALAPPAAGDFPVAVRPGGPLVGHALHHDTSPPLRSIPIVPARYDANHADPDWLAGRRYIHQPAVVDAVAQRVFGALGGPGMPAPIANFDGQYNQWGFVPPDTNGDVGPNHYVQIVNEGVQIFNKSGVSLYGPATIGTIWTGFGGLCEVENDGDPIALYDPIADRWLISQFSVPGGSQGYHECIAISASGDPTGSYYRYDFLISQTLFNDYPKFGVWPDAYYASFNFFPGGGGAVAFDRAAMLAGQAAIFVMMPPNNNDDTLLPADLDGTALPPVGEPNPYTVLDTGSPQQLRFYNFHVDFAHPANSTFTPSATLPVAPFNVPCNNDYCIPQPGTTALLDPLADRLMFRAAYRNFGDHQTIVTNHTVDVGGNPVNAGVRWYEIRSIPGPTFAPTLAQQGTYAPDANNRWMGSIAMDHRGDMALGYSVSSPSVYPSIRYTGRLVTDPPNELPQGETELFAGHGSEDYPGSGRWGDYSAMTVDPADDCTFWYTQEYFSQTGRRNWRTRIGSFKFPNCAPSPPPTITAPPQTPTPTPPASPTACPGSASYTGSLSTSDPTLTGRIPLGLASTCDVPSTCSATDDQLQRHYKSYTFANTGSTAECVTVDITQACGDNAVDSAAYLGTFNPNQLCSNYLADAGAIGPQGAYSFNLPAGQTAVVVMYENSPGLGCAAYIVRIRACGAGAPPTATPGLTPSATQTRVPSPSPSATHTVGPSRTPAATTTPTAARGSPSPTASASSTAVGVPPTPTRTRTAAPTNTLVPANTATPTGTPCTIMFSDVHPADYFYIPVEYLACKGVISGYANGTFRPYNPTTRGQMVKIVVLGLGVTGSATPVPGAYTFTDVQPGNPFFSYVEAAARAGVVSGYTCGTQPNEPCDPQHRPYFRWRNLVTRGQLAKIVALGAHWPLINPAAYTFTDVLPNTPFYTYVETAYCHGVISGYTCGTQPGEACDPQHRPYYRQYNNATRGQIAKIVYRAITAGGACAVP